MTPPATRDATVPLDELELELRRLGGVTYVGFKDEEGALVVQLLAVGAPDVGDLRERAARLSRAHVAGPVIVEVDTGLVADAEPAAAEERVELLVDVADLLTGTLRESDVIARIGGDEFCVLIIEPDCDQVALRNRLLDAFDRFNANSDRTYALSASIGMVPVAPADADTIDELLARADELMYEEKKGKPTSRRSA